MAKSFLLRFIRLRRVLGPCRSPTSETLIPMVSRLACLWWVFGVTLRSMLHLSSIALSVSKGRRRMLYAFVADLLGAA